MSAVRAWFIACNNCGCQMDDSAIPPYPTKTEAIEAAKVRGWFCPNQEGMSDYHLCPDCRNPAGAKSARTQRRNIAANRAAGLTDYGRRKAAT